MRIIELTTGITLPITNEETTLLEKFGDADALVKKELSEREAYVANRLVERDVLTRRNDNGKITYHKRLRDR